MADKEVTVFVVDVARSMGQTHQGREQSDLDWSLQYVFDKIGGIVATGRKTLQVGVVAMGTDGTENNHVQDDDSYKHISVLQPISQILVPDLQRLPTVLKPSNTNTRDVLSGIIVGLDLITKHCKHLKYRKRLIVLTNGVGLMDADDIQATAEELNKNDIELVLLGVDFDDAEYGFKEEDKAPEKAENETAFRTLVDACENGIFGTMQEAIENLERPEVKVTRPVPTYRGTLRLGDEENYDTALSIDIERYFKTSIRRPPTASAFAVRQQNNGSDSLAPVAQEFTYHVKGNRGDGKKEDIQREDLAKGYEYGRTAVHISQADENITKLETFTSYDILGFIPADNVERYMIIDNANMIVPQKGNDKAALALSSLVHGLYELGSVAVARFVKKDMTEPAIVLLSPLVEPDIECLIENVLPFAEDIRTYRFPPLDKVLTVSGKALKEHRNLPKDDLLSAMSDFVDNMSLVQDDEEILPMDDTFSPVLHTIESAIKHRAIHPDAPLAPKPALFDAYQGQPAHLQKQSNPSLDRLIKAADVKRVPPKVKGRKRYREAEKPLSGLDVDALFQKDARPKRISPENAIPEFKQLLDATVDEGEIRDGVNQMGTIVEKLIAESFGEQNYNRATEMLGVVRDGMIEMEFAGLYHTLITGLKEKVAKGALGGDRSEWWYRNVRGSKLGLILKTEGGKDEYGKEIPVIGGVSDSEAKEFWKLRNNL